MSLADAVHELIEVAAGRHPVLTHDEADALHEAVDKVEDKPEPAADAKEDAPEPAVDEAELSQEPVEAPAAPDVTPAPENPADGLYAPQGNL